jgi:hypothetical protein
MNSDIILTSDSDQAAILGAQCICIKNFKVNEKKQQITLEEFEIFFAFEQTIHECLEILHIPLESEKVVMSKCPIFDGIHCYRLRALLAVALGCDVNLNSIVTPAPLLSFIRSEFFKRLEKDDAYNALKNFWYRHGIIRIIKRKVINQKKIHLLV